MTLPLIISKNNRFLMLAVCGVIFLVGYMIPNHIHFFPPQQLPLTRLEQAIPFWEWTFFIYVSEYFLFVWAFFLFDEWENLNRTAWAFLFASFLAAVVFLLFPTTYPRELFPLMSDPNSFVNFIFFNFRRIDDPSNTFPSLHVSCCFLTALAYLDKRESRKKFYFFFTWAFFISLSTLTTKQHYLIDVVAGLLYAITVYWIFFKKIKYISMDVFLGRI